MRKFACHIFFLAYVRIVQGLESYCSAQVCPKTTLYSSSSSILWLCSTCVEGVASRVTNAQQMSLLSLGSRIAGQVKGGGEIRHERRVEWPNKERAEGIPGCNTKQCTPVLNVLMM